jgi:hypothetical protein
MRHTEHAPAADQIDTRDLPPLDLRATFRPGSVDAEKRTVDVLFSTGAPVLRGYYERFYETLSLEAKHVRMQRLNDGAPLLDTHNGFELRAVMGVVEPGTAKVDGKQGIATVRFAKAEDDPAADVVFRKVQDGIIQNISVGYRVFKFEKVEGGDDKVPTYRAIDWEPYEISFVPMGADAAAGVRAADPASVKTPCEFITRSVHQESDSMKAENTGAAPVAENTRAAEQPAVNADAVRQAATQAERDRVTGIRQAVRAAKLGENVADEFISNGTALDAARAAVLEQLAAADTRTATNPTVVVVPGEDARDKFVRGVGAWIVQKAGVAPEVARAAGVTVDKIEQPGEFRGMTLLDMAKAALDLRGVSYRGLDKMAVASLALRTQPGQTTSDFALALENTMNKVLIAAYQVTPDTWTKIAKRGTVSDFRPTNRYRMGSFSKLDALNENGEFKNKALTDAEKAQISASTFGNIVGLSRQAIVNDDMGAFSDVAMKLGRAAKLSPEVDFYALLALNAGLGPVMADTFTLFHANHANITTGAALSVSALDADRVAMASQKDKDGNDYLDLRPAVLLIAVGLGGQARVINSSQYDTEVSNKFQVPNKVVGLFREIVDTPRISGTRRYLFADPNVAPTIEVVFLDGQSEPVLESQDGWRVDGVEWKVRYDYGIGAIDWRGAATNAGV